MREYGLRQEFILPHTPEQNGVAESFMGTFKLECIWQHRFKTFAEAKRVIEAWITHYNAPTTFAARLSAAAGMAATTAPNNSLECPISAGSSHCDVALNTLAMSILSPKCASEMNNFTPRNPQRVKLRRNSVQDGSA